MVEISDEDTYIIAGALGGAVLLTATCCFVFLRLFRSEKNLHGGASESWFIPDGEGKYGAVSSKKGKKKGKKKRGKKAKKEEESLRSGVAGGASTASAAGDGGSPGGNDAARDITDSTLVNTFRSVLSEGYLVTMHTGKSRPKNIRLSLDPHDASVLRWTSTKSLTRKVHSMNLHDVLFVEVGKRTTNFTASKSGGVRVNEDLCFSLVTESMTLDIETSSKMEREAMAQGFSMILNDLKMNEAQDL